MSGNLTINRPKNPKSQKSKSHSYDLRSRTIQPTNFLGEKTVTKTSKNLKNPKFPKVPVFSTEKMSKKDARDAFSKSIKQRLVDLKMEQTLIKNEIKELETRQNRKDLKKNQQNQKNKKVDLENWTFKSHKVRTVHFDERTYSDGTKCKTPRVVTIVWTHNRATGFTRYGAVQWTQGPGRDVFDKCTQRKFATTRYLHNPVMVKFDPIPKTVYEVQNCLRWGLYDLGVSSTSKTYIKWKRTNSYKKK